MTDFDGVGHDLQVQRLQATAQAVLSRWEISGAELKLINYRENAVFEVKHGGVRKALRVHRYGYHSDAALRSEHQWVQALAAKGMWVPRVVPADSGDLFVIHEAPGLPGPMQIDLFEWVSGKQLGSVEEGVTDAASVESIYGTIGGLAAQVHEQSSAWTVPPGFVRHAWDAEGLAGEQPLWGRYWELGATTTAERDLLIRVRSRVYDDLRQLDQSTNVYSMIHADLAPENLLVEGDHVRLIDFDDAGWGWHLFELATALYFIMDRPYFGQAKDALLKGYRLHRPLSDEQLDLLPLFFLARGTTYLGWVHTRPNTETARDRTPVLLDQACGLAEAYLSG